MELRFAQRARATKDLDLGIEGSRSNRLDTLSNVFRLGFDEFSFRLMARTRDMAQADTIRVQVAVLYRTRSWQTIEVDLGTSSISRIELIHPHVHGLAELAIPVTSPVRLPRSAGPSSSESSCLHWSLCRWKSARCAGHPADRRARKSRLFCNRRSRSAHFSRASHARFPRQCSPCRPTGIPNSNIWPRNWAFPSGRLMPLAFSSSTSSAPSHKPLIISKVCLMTSLRHHGHT